jgi:hypothetical protein
LTLLSGRAAAQQRPLVTEDPEVVGAGRILIEGGFDLDRDVYYPVSGLRGDRFAVPTLGISVGLSSIAELQMDLGVYQRLHITERRPGAPLASLLIIDDDDTSDVDDIFIATKVKLFGETTGARPSAALRIATKLPNATNESGLGTDTTDVYMALLLAKTVQSLRIVGNGGYAILGDPSAVVPKQYDVVTYGFSIARAMTSAAEVVGEISGRVRPPGSDEIVVGGENQAAFRVGARYTRGTVRVDGAVIFGITPRDPEVGFTAGFTWVFNAFRVP